MLRLFSLIICFLSICMCAFAADSPASYNIPEIRSYLRTNLNIRSQNWSIGQNPENHFIYAATSDGLLEFNGITWNTFHKTDNQPIRSVFIDDKGLIFTGSFEEFGYWEYDNKGVIQYFSLSKEIDIPKNDEIWKIYSKDEAVLFQSFTSIYEYRNGKVEQFESPGTMLFMHDLDGRMMVQLLGEGLAWFTNGTFEIIDGSDIFVGKKVHSVIPFREDSWMICTDQSGLFIFDDGDFVSFPSEASDFLKNFSCNTSKQLDDSTYIFGSILNGLIVSDDEGNIKKWYNTNNGLNNNTVLSLHIDLDQGLWIGLDDGINYLDLNSPLTYYRSIGGTMGTIYTMLRKEDQLYIGTNHGLFRAKIRYSGFHYTFHDLVFIKGSQGQVWTLGVYNGQIICGHNDGTFRVEGDRFTRISDITGGWTYLQKDDHLLGGTYTGITVYQKDAAGNWQFKNKPEEYSDPTRYLETDYLGYIWASHHQKGVFKLELSDDMTEVVGQEQYIKINGESSNIRVFNVNNRVVFLTGNNIYTWDFVRDEMVPFDALRMSLVDFDNATQIIQEGKNRYWFVTPSRIALFDIQLDFSTEKIVEFTRETISLPHRQLPIVSLDEKTILLPNQPYFEVIEIEAAKTQKKDSRLFFNKLSFYSDTDTLVFFDSVPTKKISYNTRNLIVHFANPSHFDDFPKRYHYRIKELDDAWQITTQNHFTYLNLENGDYTLELSLDKKEVIRLSFSIDKPWYTSNLAIIIYALLFIILIYAAYLFFRFEVRRQRELATMEIRKDNLEKELDYKSYELMLTMRHLLLKDGILTELKEKIENLKKQSSKYPVKHIQSIEKVVKQGIGTQSIEWENAMNNLKLSQQGFFKTLKNKYPELTTNDLRLCSYLRMNFSTKEIAQLLNISTRGVEMSRHRLRKKLGLQHDENLVEFLMNDEFDSAD